MPARVIYFNFPRLLLYACCKDRTGPDRRTGVLGVKGWDVAFLAHSICACVLMSMEILVFFLHTRSRSGRRRIICESTVPLLTISVLKIRYMSRKTTAGEAFTEINLMKVGHLERHCIQVLLNCTRNSNMYSMFTVVTEARSHTHVLI